MPQPEINDPKFVETFKELLDKNIQGNKDEAWRHASLDLANFVVDANKVLKDLTANVLAIKMETLAKKEHVPGIGDVTLVRLSLWNKAEEKSVGALEVFKVPANGEYPVLTSQNMPLGDKEALKMKLYTIFGDARSELFNIIRSVQEAVG
jgi:hypothetical protein